MFVQLGAVCGWMDDGCLRPDQGVFGCFTSSTLKIRFLIPVMYLQLPTHRLCSNSTKRLQMSNDVEKIQSYVLSVCTHTETNNKSQTSSLCLECFQEINEWIFPAVIITASPSLLLPLTRQPVRLVNCHILLSHAIHLFLSWSGCKNKKK